jgi:apolipoprotein N-acyltransferase
MEYASDDRGLLSPARPGLPRSLALAVSSALLMTLAVPNELFAHGLPPLGFIALVPLYVALLDLRSHRSAALVVGVFGALQHGLTSFWLWNFHDFRIWTLGSTTFAYLLVYAVLGLYLWLFLARSGTARPLAFALLWTAFEHQKSTGFLGYPWGLLPYSLTDALPLLQIADLAGVYGISLVLAFFNAGAAELLLGLGARDAWRGAAAGRSLSVRARVAYSSIALGLVLACLGYGLARMGTPIPRAGTIGAILVQQNTDPWDEPSDEASVAVNIALARKALAAAPRKPDLILFSETTLMRPFAEFRSYYTKKPSGDPLIPFIKESGAWLFTGAPEIVDWQTYDATNSAILIDPQARLVKSYAKVHPVPFAEAIPFWDVPWFKSFIQKTVGLESGWVSGTKYTIFELPTPSGTFRFGAPICFEDAFADVSRNFALGGADLLVNLTNIAWSRTRSAEVQHWAAARLRAIEQRKTLVRSTNGGVSCIVGPYGETLDSMPLFKADSKYMEIPVYRIRAPTPYVAWGDWLAYSALLLCAVLTLILYVEGRQSSRGGSAGKGTRHADRPARERSAVGDRTL